MENRSRKNQLKIYLNDEELALFREKMKMTN
ncbi:MAG: plasmid mobilization relaxosome protein MobC, partial [Tissierellia bacterium]|nr:plasmid mobilization relaxosome protein MobC [Tissierellia bacterium]